jgi:hypothetical protein
MKLAAKVTAVSRPPTGARAAAVDDSQIYARSDGLKVGPRGHQYSAVSSSRAEGKVCLR